MPSFLQRWKRRLKPTYRVTLEIWVGDEYVTQVDVPVLAWHKDAAIKLAMKSVSSKTTMKASGVNRMKQPADR